MNNSIWYNLKLKFFKSGSPAMLYIGINGLIFLLASLLTLVFFLAGYTGLVPQFVQDYLAFPSSIEQLPFRFYTFITYQFLHKDFFHILFNMLWLYWMGEIFLSFLKPRQFHFVYLGGGISGALVFLLLYQFVPAFANQSATVIGSSASVMAILVATATLVPDYSIRLMFIGNLKIKYLVFAYVILDVLGTAGENAGGNMAHLGGALFGFIFIKLLQKGRDWSTIFKRKPKLKVVKNPKPKPEKRQHAVDQEQIDAILDKISKSGYDQLSKAEKETLFKASKH